MYMAVIRLLRQKHRDKAIQYSVKEWPKQEQDVSIWQRLEMDIVSNINRDKLIFVLNERSYHFTQSRRDAILIDSSIDGHKTPQGWNFLSIFLHPEHVEGRDFDYVLLHFL